MTMGSVEVEAAAQPVGNVPRPVLRPTAATVLVCDRLRAVAESLAGYLDAAPGLAAPRVATTSAELMASLEAERSDLVVLDSAVRWDGVAAGGDSLVAAVRRSHPDTKVLMIGSTREPDAVAQALREGALGWLTVDCSAPQLTEAAFGVLRGEYRIAPGLLAAALHAGSRAAEGRDAGRASALLARLSERERLVLSCLVGGMHRREIAAKFGIAETTARTHISRILAKLGAHSMIEAAALGRRAGLSAIEP
jgi:DNA-binding NarL/FixJ family response regulator